MYYSVFILKYAIFRSCSIFFQSNEVGRGDPAARWGPTPRFNCEKNMFQLHLIMTNPRSIRGSSRRVHPRIPDTPFSQFVMRLFSQTERGLDTVDAIVLSIVGSKQ